MRSGRNAVNLASDTIDTKVVPISILRLGNLWLATHLQKVLLAVVHAGCKSFEMNSQVFCSPFPTFKKCRYMSRILHEGQRLTQDV